MTPERFIAKLSAQFSTRHDTDDQAAEWMGQMLDALKGYPGDVLEKVARDMIHERKTRSFPLIAEIREITDRYTPKNRYDDDLSAYRVHRQRVEYTSTTDQYRLAKEWRDKVCASHGSVDNWLKATVHLRRDGALGKGMSPARSSFRPIVDAVTLPTPTRELMQSLQGAAVKTADGFERHARRLSPQSRRMMGDSDE